MAHICIGNLTIIASDNGLSPERRQAIIWTSAGILLIEPLVTNFSEISIGIQTFSFKKMHFKMSSAKWRPFCLGLNVFTLYLLMLWHCPEISADRMMIKFIASICMELAPEGLSVYLIIVMKPYFMTNHLDWLQFFDRCYQWHLLELLSHPSIPGVTLCFCTGSYAAAADSCSHDNFWTTFWISFIFGTIIGPDL